MKELKIDIVSDVSCPWCIIGYKGLEKALDNTQEDVKAEIEWHPFELNPQMPSQGQELVEHLTEKYNISEAQCEQNKQVVEQRGLDAGYEFGIRGGGRIYNTFDAHRLLHWAKEHKKQTDLKLALFDLYFKQGGDPSNHAQLLTLVSSIGLPLEEATEILESQKYSAEIRREQQASAQKGISSVPAVIVNDKYLISGGQTAEVYSNLLLKIANDEIQ